MWHSQHPWEGCSIHKSQRSTKKPSESVCLQPGRVVVMTSSFPDSIVFAVQTGKTALSNSTVFKLFHYGERFETDLFSLIVFGVGSVDGSRIRNRTVSFSFENGVVWTGSKSTTTSCQTMRQQRSFE